MIVGLELWQAIKVIFEEHGNQTYGNLSEFGVEQKMREYLQGEYSLEVHEFYSKYAHVFLRCREDEELLKMRRRFNKEIENKTIRYK